MAWNSEAHIRRFDEKGFDEEQGAYRKPKEARTWQEGFQEPRQGGLQAKEGDIQAF